MYLEETSSIPSNFVDNLNPFVIETQIQPTSKGPICSISRQFVSNEQLLYFPLLVVFITDDLELRFLRQNISIPGDSPISLDTKYTIKAVYDGQKMILYLDGIEVASISSDQVMNAGTYVLRLGAQPTFGAPVNPNDVLKTTFFYFKMWNNATGSGKPHTYYDFKNKDKTQVGDKIINQGTRDSQLELKQYQT